MLAEKESNPSSWMTDHRQLPLFSLETTTPLSKPPDAGFPNSVTNIATTTHQSPVEPQSTRPGWKWRRLGTGIFFTVLGGVAIAIGVNSVLYRWRHLVIDHGILNGRTVSLQAPIDGSLTTFYAYPGVAVKQGQALALIQNTLQTEQKETQTLLELDGEIAAYSAQLVAANQSLALLQQQLQELEGQNRAIQSVDTALQAKQVTKYQAAVDAAIAKANAANMELNRYRSLAAEGVISHQRVDQAALAAAASNAEVKQAQADLALAQTSLQAASQGIGSQTSKINLLEQQRRLQQAIQTQTALIGTLETQLHNRRQQQQQAQGHQQGLKQLTVNAPFSGVIYQTYQEVGEQVNRGQPLVSLLDCQSLWVEAVVAADEAASIDLQQPVLVHLAGLAQPLEGQIDLIQPLGQRQIGHLTADSRVQAIAPVIPPSLSGQTVQRVTVRVPPPPQHTNSQKFCGVGQTTRLSFRRKR